MATNLTPMLVFALSSSCAAVISGVHVNGVDLVGPDKFEAALADDVLSLDINVKAGQPLRLDADLARGSSLRVKELVDCSSGLRLPLFTPLYEEHAAPTELLLDSGAEARLRVRYPLALAPPARVPECVRGTIQLVPEQGEPLGAVPFEARRKRH